MKEILLAGFLSYLPGNSRMPEIIERPRKEKVLLMTFAYQPSFLKSVYSNLYGIDRRTDFRIIKNDHNTKAAQTGRFYES